MQKETKFYIILAFFIAVATIINPIASKIVEIFGLTFSVSAYAYALTFPITDTVTEVWGKRRARLVVLLGFMANLIVVAFVVLAVNHPPAEFWAPNDEAFGSTLGVVPRIVFGGMCAYLVSQFHDIWAFHFWKKLTRGKHLWLRNNLSTFVSQLIDTLTFVLISFAGVLPTDVLPSIVLGQYVIKIVIAGVDTPVVYLLVKWISGEWQTRESEEERVEPSTTA